jgi:hypothetical protein
MPTQPCIHPPHRDSSPIWRLIFIIVLLIFASVAQIMGMTTEVIVLLITTVTAVALQLFGLPSAKPLTIATAEPR